MKTNEHQLAPLVVFAFNRPEALRNTLSALKNNPLSSQTNLFIFVDGQRNEIDASKIAKVKDVINQFDGFKSINVSYSDINKGLGASIISGTTKIINQYGKIIVVEDDLYVSPGFLSFMNKMLQEYKDDNRIMQISGYGTKVRCPKSYQCNYYLNKRAHSWTWGTWKDRWNTVDWEVKDYGELVANKAKQKVFNEYGSDLFGMLKGYMEGRNHSWYIRFNYSMFKQGKYTICPIRSLVRNDGFGEEATNCKTYNRYKIDFDNLYYVDYNIPEHIEWNEKLNKQAVKYWSIRYRILGKIMEKILLLRKIFE
jgi:hypothetical protein